MLTFLFSFLHVVLSDNETYVLPLPCCLPAFEKLVEQHINLIQYSTSLLWNCLLTISTNISNVKCATRTESYNIVLNTFCFCFHIIALKNTAKAII